MKYIAYPNVGSTAIRRKKKGDPTLSKPAAMIHMCLMDKGTDIVLDYGCGRGDDFATLKSWGWDIQGYDPVYKPERPLGKFTVILCTYVLNVLPKKADRETVLHDIVSLLEPGGKAYVTVRRDLKRTGWTQRDTWQGQVKIGGAKSYYRSSNYETYIIVKEDDHGLTCPQLRQKKD